MSLLELAIMIGVVLGLMVVVYLIVVLKKEKKHCNNKRCEDLLKQLDEEPYNVTTGESVYGSKKK